MPLYTACISIEFPFSAGSDWEVVLFKSQENFFGKIENGPFLVEEDGLALITSLLAVCDSYDQGTRRRQKTQGTTEVSSRWKPL